jgi:1,4-alpha-glucan branching enzyme
MEGRVLEAEKTKWHNKEFSINIKVPPLGATFIKGKDIIF